jgi:putative transposase
MGGESSPKIVPRISRQTGAEIRKSRFSESQIIQILNEGESGIPIADLCWEHGISRSAYYKWKAKYGGMNVNELNKLRELEIENRRLKQKYAELSLDHNILKVLSQKSCKARRAV